MRRSPSRREFVKWSGGMLALGELARAGEGSPGTAVAREFSGC